MNEQDKNQKKIFEEEQAHLTQTHGKLRAMKEELEERINTISEKAAKEKQDIRSNLSLNFDSDTDSMETYIEFEAMSHSITQYNIEQDAAAEKLGRVKRLLKAPYFARVKLQFDPSEEPEDYYIGSAGVSENAFEHLVIDWRSPIAETYYNQENGKTFYTVNGKRVDVDLQLRRQYNLEEDRLFSFFDTQVAIEDPMLLQSLASSRTDKMKAITATIQKEQNAVIRCALCRCAGAAGKRHRGQREDFRAAAEDRVPFLPTEGESEAGPGLSAHDQPGVPTVHRPGAAGPRRGESEDDHMEGFCPYCECA